jgi:hypothetical protein
MIEPAIADLQAEASFGLRLRLKHYVGLVFVLMRAGLEDLRLDFLFGFDRESWRVAWKRAGFWYAGAALFFATLSLTETIPWDRIDSGLWPQALVSAAMGGVVAATWPATICVIVYLYRRRESRRSVLAIGLLLCTLTTSLALAVRPLRMSADQAISRAIDARAAQDPGSVHGEHNVYRTQDLDRNIAWWKDVLTGVQLMAWVPIGVILARRRGIRVAVTIPFIFFTWSLSVWTLWRLGNPGNPSPESYPQQRWREIGLNVFVALVWLVYDAVKYRLRPREVV